MNSLRFTLPSLPMIFQAESNECGLACLAMIGSYHGYKVDLHGLRTRFGPVALGSSAKHLLNLASQIELRGRALKFDLHDLKNLKLPAILHWNMDHFVVVKKIGRRSITVHDPAAGIKQYTIRELGFHLTGIALEFSPTANFKKNKKTSNIPIARLFKDIEFTSRNVAQIFIMTLVIQLLALLNPLYLQLVIDQGLIKGDAELVLMLGLVFAVVILLKSAVVHLRGMYLLQFGNRIGFQLLGNSAHHLLSLPSDFFSRREMGDIVSRFGSLDNIRKLITQEMITVVVDGIFSVITLAMLFLYSPLLASVVLSIVSLVVIVRLGSISHERNLRKLSLITYAKQQTKFMENIRSIRTSKVNGIELDRLSEWETDLVGQLNSSFGLESFHISLGTFQSIVLGIENIVVIYLGANAVIGSSMTLGQLMSFIFLKQHFSSSVFAMLPKLSELRMLNLEVERVSDFLATPKESTAAENSFISFSAGKKIEFRNLSIFYPGSTVPLTDNLNFEIETGQCIALTGSSGCGKSTLLKTLLKLEPNYRGEIIIGGHTLEKMSRHELRAQVSAVMHDDVLLSGDLAYNINLGIGTADHEKLTRLCAELGINELIESLPLGLCTEVGELGNLLSAGQMQRILLARALYRSPKLLLLDESLSHLNHEAAAQLLHVLKKSGATIILVTHDARLISLTDKELRLS